MFIQHATYQHAPTICISPLHIPLLTSRAWDTGSPMFMHRTTEGEQGSMNSYHWQIGMQYAMTSAELICD